MLACSDKENRHVGRVDRREIVGETAACRAVQRSLHVVLAVTSTGSVLLIPRRARVVRVVAGYVRCCSLALVLRSAARMLTCVSVRVVGSPGATTASSAADTSAVAVPSRRFGHDSWC